MTLTDRISIGMGKIPFWFRQQGLVSRSAETIRPGGFILTQRALDVCGFSAGDPVLDAGCGVGMTLGYLHDTAGIRAVGLDRDPVLLARIAKRSSFKRPLILAGLPELPLASRTFKGIFCECVLSLVPDPVRCLGEFKRILSPGGYLVLSDLYLRKWLPDYVRQDHPPTCAQGAAPLMQMMSWLQAAGLDIHVMEEHSSLLTQLGGMVPGQLSPGPGPAGNSIRKKPRLGYAMIIAQRV